MAGGESGSSKKRKRPKKRAPQEEVVITLGTPKKKKTQEEGTIKIGKKDSQEPIKIAPESEDDFGFEEEIEEEIDEEPEYEQAEEFEEEPDDDVVVISLGAPPKKKVLKEEEEVVLKEPEKGSSEEIEEVEPVEAEVVEEESGEKEKKPKEKPQRKKKLAAIVIVLIVIFGSIGFYIFVVQNQVPKAQLLLTPDSPMAGELVTMDASGSSDDRGIVRYDWNFGDGGKYSEASGDVKDGKFDKKTTHSYEGTGDYTVTLTVWDDSGKKGTVKQGITVSELEVTVPVEKIEDAITYDINGSIDVENKDGLMSFPSDFGEITVNKIELVYEGYMDSSIEGTISQEDGFGVSHNTLEKYNYQNVIIDGTVSGSIEISGTGNPFSYPIDEGTLEVRDRAFIDLSTNKTIFSHTISDFQISAGSDLGIESLDDLRTYSNLRAEPAVLRVEDLSSDRAFKIGQKQTKIIGEIAYSWEVERATNIKGYPSLQITIDIDGGTKDRMGLEEFVMEMYIANDISFPVKTYIYSRFYSDGTTTEIIYNNEIQYDDQKQEGNFKRGNEFIPWGTCTTSSPDGHYHRRNPGFEFVNWGSGDYLPDMGSNSTNFEFSPQDAISWGKSDSSDFSTYLTNNPNAYVIDGYYNETQEHPTWNLTFGEMGDDTGYYIIEENDGGSHRVLDENFIDISELRNSTDDFDLVLSYSGGQKVFQEDEVVNDEVFNQPSGDVRFYDGINYGSSANMVYPTLSLTISLAIERADYGYYLYKEDGSLSAAVDAINGQYIYVWEHDGDDVMSILLAFLS